MRAQHTAEDHCPTPATPPPPAPLCPRRLPAGSGPATPAPPPAAGVLTEVVRVAQVEGVAAVHVVVQGLLDQVLRLVPGQLRHPVGTRGCVRGPALQMAFPLHDDGSAHVPRAKSRGRGRKVDLGK